MRRRKKHFTFSFFFDHFMKVIQDHKRYLKLCPVNQYILLNFKRTIVLFVRIFEVIGGIGIVSWHEEQLDRILPLLLRCILCCFSEIIRLAWTISQDKAQSHIRNRWYRMAQNNNNNKNSFVEYYIDIYERKSHFVLDKIHIIVLWRLNCTAVLIMLIKVRSKCKMSQQLQLPLDKLYKMLNST